MGEIVTFKQDIQGHLVDVSWIPTQYPRVDANHRTAVSNQQTLWQIEGIDRVATSRGISDQNWYVFVLIVVDGTELPVVPTLSAVVTFLRFDSCHAEDSLFIIPDDYKVDKILLNFDFGKKKKNQSSTETKSVEDEWVPFTTWQVHTQLYLKWIVSISGELDTPHNNETSAFNSLTYMYLTISATVT